jgi:hypothetical protein
MRLVDKCGEFFSIDEVKPTIEVLIAHGGSIHMMNNVRASKSLCWFQL